MVLRDPLSIKTLYHWVRTREQRDYVLRNGITVDSDGFIYLSEKPLNTTHPCWTPSDGYVFEVTIPDNSYLYNWEDFWLDDNGEEVDFDHQRDDNNPYYIYTTNIPVKYVELV